MSTKINDNLLLWYDFVVDRTDRNDIYDFSGNDNRLLIGDTNPIWYTEENLIELPTDCTLEAHLDITLEPNISISMYLNKRESVSCTYLLLRDNIGDYLYIRDESLFIRKIDTSFLEINIGSILNGYLSCVVDFTNNKVKIFSNGVIVLDITSDELFTPINLTNISLNSNNTSSNFRCGNIRLYNRILSDDEIFNLVKRVVFIDGAKIYSKSFNTDSVIVPKIKNNGIDYKSFDGSLDRLSLTQDMLISDGIEVI